MMMKKFLDNLVTGLTYLVISSLLLLNYIVVTSECYLGSFHGNEISRLSPPYRTSFKIISYDLERDSLSLSTIDGFVLTYGAFNDETDLYVVKTRGVDLYILVSSLFILIAMFLIRRGIEHYGLKTAFTAFSLLLIIIITNFVYLYESFKPIQDHILVELNKPLVCTKQGDSNICVLDRFSERSKIYVKPGVKADVAISTGNNLVTREVDGDYSEIVDPKGGEAIIALRTVSEPSNLTYRRLTITQPRDGRIHNNVLDILTVSASCLKAALLAIIAGKRRSVEKSALDVKNSAGNEDRC